jgi:hypothetical protein
MNISAKTLVHAASMPIARHAVRTFSTTHRGLFRELEIHTDGTLTDEHRSELGELTAGMAFRFVEPEERRVILEKRIKGYPDIQSLMSGRGYFSKMELPMVSSEPYFYFDSDIVWLRPCRNLIGDGSQNLFSTETWTWYPGIRKVGVWARSGIPRRVNSGFYFLKDCFPFERMERLLSEGLYNPESAWATDQELMAFLYPCMRLYHPDDLMRSRRGMIYDLPKLEAAALHFPGRMWEPHLEQLDSVNPIAETLEARIVETDSLTMAELLRMRLTIGIAQSSWSRIFIAFYRRLRSLSFHLSRLINPLPYYPSKK